ncbi:U4/U6-U5 snRNP complex subunit PRP6 NDAI_0A05760 [Naumovozyma dairenensis CBS 421]|uniref:PRP1 splicing factor N-terminal domain-containing protein n=1 Tax=Naumovozyma dairenensis (strain ATCC 10597 / BCRC 20456 / CBS 421 / NBRC 0211 / NRRL Y-12639) TaxID=1071378 RepID=G0W4J3_NAUDC|nr:hypothetical protein NDAI_0A05760 [Naumovozyma dairenensis CBS 421]CCD22731.1 hypothetical protein NDAI_0A05760 [Naumovozyma dairenensis CBS 421]
MERPSFLDQSPPPGYVAGVGRGATGFSTRGGKYINHKLPKRLQGNITNEIPIEDTTDEEEAEEVFAGIEKKLTSKRMHKTSNLSTTSRDPISDIPHQFADLKRSLATVSEEEWLHIPEAGDTTRRNKRNRMEEQQHRKTYAAPDSLISKSVDLVKLTEEREKILARKLDSGFDDLKRQTDSGSVGIIDKLESLITDVSNITPTSNDDIKKTRLILQSYRRSEPRKPDAWLASIKLEDNARNFRLAKNLAEEGCSNCPKSVDLWLENIRLHCADLHRCKVLVTSAIRFNPQSVALWLKGVELENEALNKYRVVRKALQEMPYSEELWKLAIKYEKDKVEGLKILERAVAFVPKSLSLWKALINIQEPAAAKVSLKKARKYLPNDADLCVLDCQLEEMSNPTLLEADLSAILHNYISHLKNNKVQLLSLKQWLEKARKLEDEEKYKLTFMTLLSVILAEYPLEECVNELKSFEPCRTKLYCFKTLLINHQTDLNLWNIFIEACDLLDNKDEMYTTFDGILFYGSHPSIIKKNQDLILKYGKEICRDSQDSEKALSIFNKALYILPESSKLLSAKFKLLCTLGRFDEAEILATNILEKNSVDDPEGVEKFHYYYASLLRYNGQNEKAIQFLSESCLPHFPKNYKFYLQLGQIYIDTKDYKTSREIYLSGTKELPDSPLLWIYLARTDEIYLKNTIRARSELDTAILKNPTLDILLITKAQMESRLENYQQAELIVDQGLMKFPKSPGLWVERIRLLGNKRASQRKTIFQDALKKTGNDHAILLEIGMSLYSESQYQASLKWFERAVRKNPRYGDSWIWLFRCMKK